jgi:aminodeoxyfutalosine synthase
MSVTDTELASLSASHDIINLGMLADEVRRALHGSRTTFVRVASVGPEPGGAIAVPPAAGEVRIVGVPVSRTAAIARVQEVASLANGAPTSGFSLADIEQLAARDGVSRRTLLEDLRAAGLDLIAEAPFDRLDDPQRSIEEVNIAGLTLARLTVEEPASEATSLLRAVAALQRAVGVIRAFSPLARRPDRASPTTGYDDVKRVALARLVVDNVPMIQIDWSLYGPKLAQVALTVGADDVDGVSAQEAGPEGRRRSPLEEILRNIRVAGLDPVERNGRFETLVR